MKRANKTLKSDSWDFFIRGHMNIEDMQISPCVLSKRTHSGSRGNRNAAKTLTVQTPQTQFNTALNTGV